MKEDESAFKKWIDDNPDLQKALNGLTITPEMKAEIVGILQKGFAILFEGDQVQMLAAISPKKVVELTELMARIRDRAGHIKMPKNDITFVQGLLTGLLQPYMMPIQRIVLEDPEGTRMEIDSVVATPTAMASAFTAFIIGIAYIFYKHGKPPQKGKGK